MAFLTVMLGLAAVLTRLYFYRGPGGWAGWLGTVAAVAALAGVVLLGLGVTAAPLAVGIRRFERMEF